MMKPAFKRYEVVESQVWRHITGRTASVYGAVPYQNDFDKKDWKVEVRGFTVRDNNRGTVGIGRIPWPTREEAQAWADAANDRNAPSPRLYT